MPVATTLAFRGLTLLGVLFVSLLLVVAALGATGYSDRMMNAIVGEELRGLRQALAQTIRDPDKLESAVEARRGELMRLYGLDKPWYFRLPAMVIRVVTLDLGEARTLRSFTGSSRVADIVMERVANTVALVTVALAMTAVIGLIVGVRAATLVGTRFDKAVSYLSVTSYALPAWWTGIFLILVFSLTLRILPSGGLYSAPPPIDPLMRFLDLIWHAILPVLTLVLVSAGGWIYVVRTMVLNTAREDFVTVARAKGLPENLIMRRYVLRVAAPPILTGIILGLAGSIGGAILTETVFNWPGMGRLYYEAIFALDEPLVVALTFLFTLIYVAARFTLEVLYVLVDPRVRYS